MSLVLGLVCPDGVVLAADSGMSLGGTPELSLSLPAAEKTWAMGSVVVGVAGSASAAQHVAVALAERPLLVESLAELRRDVALRLHRGVPPAAGRCHVLLAGVIEGRPRLLQVTETGEDVEHTDTPGRGSGPAFAAVGQPAGVLASAMLAAGYRRTGPGTVAEALLLAYDVLETTTWIVPSLRRPFVFWAVTPTGAYRLEPGALRELEVGLTRYRAITREARQAVAGKLTIRCLPAGHAGPAEAAQG